MASRRTLGSTWSSSSSGTFACFAGRQSVSIRGKLSQGLELLKIPSGRVDRLGRRTTSSGNLHLHLDPGTMPTGQRVHRLQGLVRLRPYSAPAARGQSARVLHLCGGRGSSAGANSCRPRTGARGGPSVTTTAGRTSTAPTASSSSARSRTGPAFSRPPRSTREPRPPDARAPGQGRARRELVSGRHAGGGWPARPVRAC